MTGREGGGCEGGGGGGGGEGGGEGEGTPIGRRPLAAICGTRRKEAESFYGASPTIFSISSQNTCPSIMCTS